MEKCPLPQSMWREAGCRAGQSVVMASAASDITLCQPGWEGGRVSGWEGGGARVGGWEGEQGGCVMWCGEKGMEEGGAS